ncbi:MAG: glucokinase, partial [Spirochaetia bacterium]
VHNRTVQLTNARWNVDAGWVEEELQVPVSLINDLSAISYAVPLVERSDPGQYLALTGREGAAGPQPTGTTRAVVAPGTGLGVGFLSGEGVALRVQPSEGGHSVMGDYDPETRRFRDFVRSRFGEMPDAETFVSGQGVANAADFVAHEGGFKSGPVAEELKAAAFQDRPAIVSRYADTDSDCARAMRLFKRMYGKFAANMALTFLPYAGLYLAGGVTEKNVHHLIADNTFMEAFLSHDNEAMRKPLSRIPVGIIRNYDISLFGCAHSAYLEVQRGGQSV